MPTPRSFRPLWFILWISCTGLPATALAQAPPAATSAPAIRDDVRKLHNDALLALKHNQVEAAYKGFLQAWSLQKIPRIAGNLGRVELKLGKYRDAAEHLALFLRESNGLGEEERKDLEAQLAQAKAQVGVVRVSVVQDAAEVSVDGAAIGTAPLPHEIYLNPGRHTVVARHAGAEAKMEINARPRAEEMVRLDLSPPPSAPPGPSEPPSARSSASNVAGSRSLVPAIVLGSVGAASLVAAAVCTGMYSVQRDEAFALYNGIQMEGGRCNEGGSEHQNCGALRTIAHEADMFRGAAPVLLGSGLALAAAAGAYLLWWPISASPKAASGSAVRARVSLISTPQGGAASISAHF